MTTRIHQLRIWSTPSRFFLHLLVTWFYPLCHSISSEDHATTKFDHRRFLKKEHSFSAWCGNVIKQYFSIKVYTSCTSYLTEQTSASFGSAYKFQLLETRTNDKEFSSIVKINGVCKWIDNEIHLIWCATV